MTGYFRVDIEMPLDDYDCILSDELLSDIEYRITQALNAIDVEIYDHAIYDDRGVIYDK